MIPFEITALVLAVVVLGWLLGTTLNHIKHMAENQTELAAEIRANNALIRANTDQVIKGQREVITKITRLEEIISQGGTITQELKDAVAETRAAAEAQSIATQGLDDVVPDDVPTPTPETSAQ